MLNNTPIVHKQASNWALPSSFCWTRMGDESGEALDRIVRRKELERRAAGGMFVWGIGNGLGIGLQHLVMSQADPEVLFSPIRSQAAAIDRNPAGVLLWLDYVRPNGTVNPLPAASLVTSRNSSAKGTNKALHFCLFCHSETPLNTSNLGTVRFGELRNLATQKPVGFSQVTAVVDRSGAPGSKRDLEYQVVLAAHLVDPFFARLSTPVALSAPDAQFLESVATSGNESNWISAVCSIKDRYRSLLGQGNAGQIPLFA